MNWDQVQGQWKQLRGRVKERWGRLTDHDLTVIAGQREQLVGKLQSLYGLTREEIDRDVDEFCYTCDLPYSTVSGPD